MALRLYFNNEAPSFTPSTPLSSWNSTTGYVTERMAPTKAGANTSVVVSTSVTTTDFTLLHGLWITDPFTVAATIPTSDTLDLTIGRVTSVNHSVGSVWRAYVTVGNSTTKRGTIFEKASTNGWGSAAGNGGWNPASPTSSINVHAGDRLVYEMGVQTLTTSGTRTATVWYGNGGGGDFSLTAGDSAVTTKCGWTEVTGVLETLWTVPPLPPGAFLPFFGQ